MVPDRASSVEHIMENIVTDLAMRRGNIVTDLGWNGKHCYQNIVMDPAYLHKPGRTGTSINTGTFGLLTICELRFQII